MLGQQIGNYRITAQIGEGGMGAVYAARHTLLDKTVAVKVLLPHLSHDQEIVTRFFNEAKATTVIKNPGIVELYDFGHLDNGSAYIVMEHLSGEGLDARIASGGRMNVMAATGLVRQIATILSAAHAHGIVHRDLKPENVFLVPDPAVEGGERPKVLDFGIAKLGGDLASTTGSTVRTRAGAIIGSPLYMSPEQCIGDVQVDHRADIYSLGCMLFELLCGSPPFFGKGPGELLAAHIYAAPPDPRSLEPSVPRKLASVLLRSLAKNPEARFASMDDFATALRPFCTTDLRDSGIVRPTASEEQGADPDLYEGELAAQAGFGAQQAFPSGSLHVPGTSLGTELSGRAVLPGHASEPGQGSVPQQLLPGRALPGHVRPEQALAGQSVPGEALPQQVFDAHHSQAPQRFAAGSMHASAPPVAASAQRLAAPTTLGGSTHSASIQVQAPSSKRGLISVALVALIAGGGLSYALVSSKNKSDSGISAVQLEQHAPPEQASEQVIEPAEAEQAPSAEVTLKIDSEPRACGVYDASGTLLGATPYDYVAPRKKGAIDLVLKHEGFFDRSISLSLENDDQANYALAPKPKGKGSSAERTRATLRQQEEARVAAEAGRVAAEEGRSAAEIERAEAEAVRLARLARLEEEAQAKLDSQTNAKSSSNSKAKSDTKQKVKRAGDGALDPFEE